MKVVDDLAPYAVPCGSMDDPRTAQEDGPPEGTEPGTDPGEPSGGPLTFDAIKANVYRSLKAEGHGEQLSITLATIYARYETELPETMGQLREVVGMIQSALGSGGGSGKILKMLIGGGK